MDAIIFQGLGLGEADRKLSGNYAGHQNNGYVLNSNTADDAAGREPKLYPVGKNVEAYVNIDYLMTMAGGKGGSGGFGNWIEASDRIEKFGAAFDQGFGAYSSIKDMMQKPATINFPLGPSDTFTSPGLNGLHAYDSDHVLEQVMPPSGKNMNDYPVLNHY